jgi:hypothetical protein
MSASKSRIAYEDCYKLFEQALISRAGIRIKLPNAGDSYSLRVRLNQARRIDRVDNMETYPEGHRLYGRSQYDQIVVRRGETDGQHWLELLKIDEIVYDVEELGEAAE